MSLSYLLSSAMVFLSAAALVAPEPDPMVGAWHGQEIRGEQRLEVVVLFTEQHQVAAWYDLSTGSLVHTNGGTWSRDGLRVTETVWFDSDNPGRAGSDVSFDIELTDSTLAIVGSPMQLTRMDRGGEGLAGAWIAHSTTESNQPAAGPQSIIRLHSSTRFQTIHFASQTGVVSGTQGGSYELTEGHLREWPEFSVGDQFGPTSTSVELDGSDAWVQRDDANGAIAWQKARPSRP